ncbi:hypothetical protein PHSY_001786 [Pseudozyma hubeiensis SY62]|uniref:Uncharacterized protein n=1 Tax=Pseudozyma hubeiensis (strain SY62) TaxID=1305764 RepID=R9P7Z1_PSEHS|nr:hypothetical protein PHSY_001786 [Pseudozyma hubeiensis SY62]GAC94215.1 hypothetical protein PHSY_001786 [Pseudozyma hubeiensis SY62]
MVARLNLKKQDWVSAAFGWTRDSVVLAALVPSIKIGTRLQGCATAGSDRDFIEIRVCNGISSSSSVSTLERRVLAELLTVRMSTLLTTDGTPND